MSGEKIKTDDGNYNQKPNPWDTFSQIEFNNRQPAIESSESVYGRMPEQQMKDIAEDNQANRQEAKQTVGEAILQGDNIKNIEKVAFNNNLRAEFLSDYHEEAINMMNKYSNDFSEGASTEVNQFVANYCSIIFAMDNINREEGKKLLDVASNGYEISGKDSTLDELTTFMRKRQKKGCDINIPVPIKYSDENPHPTLEANKVLVWLDNRLNQKELDTSKSTLDLKEEVETKLTGKTAY